MIKLSIKQAWNLMKQNKLFTGIYVAGTGLAIAMTMTVFIVLYVKFAPIYPEYNRDRTLVLKYISRTNKDKSPGKSASNLPYKMVDMLCDLPHLDKIGALWKQGQGYSVTIPQTQAERNINCTFTDKGYWEVFTYRFLGGRPFTDAEVTSSRKVVILTESMAKTLIGNTEAVGKYVRINGNEYQVCGVVEDVSAVTPVTNADLFLPLHFWPRSKFSMGLLGSLELYMTATSASDKEALRAEIQDVINRYNQEDMKYEWNLMEQPDDYWKSTFRTSMHEAPNMKELTKGLLYILFALLFIPALNLSGMISSRMNRRVSEFGIRKSYGATNVQIIGQVLSENLLLSLIGGIVGILFSYIIVLFANEWIMYIFTKVHYINPFIASPVFTFEMLFNPTLFVLVLGLCLVLNLISALIPTLWALRRPIVECLYTKR